MKVLVVPVDTDQRVRVEEVAGGDSSRFLDDVARLVGTDRLDATMVGRGIRAWVRDEGMLDGSLINERLTQFRHDCAVAAGHPGGYPSPHALYGDAVVLGGPDQAGNETAVDDAVVAAMTELDRWYS